MCQVLTHRGFSAVSPNGNCTYVHYGSLRQALGQSDEPFDLRGSLSPTTQHRHTHVLVIVYKPEAGNISRVHSTLGSTVHPIPLNNLDHCICTTTVTNIRRDRDSRLVPTGYKHQLIRMSYRGLPHPDVYR